jgi:hypothetical protein
MRLPADSILVLGEGADPTLVEVWREERLAEAPLGAELDTLPTATLVVCGAGGFEAAALASALGFRTFLVGESAPEGARAVSAAQAIEAARGARARERWKAARAAGSDG